KPRGRHQIIGAVGQKFSPESLEVTEMVDHPRIIGRETRIPRMRWSLVAVIGSFALAGLLPCASALTISGSVFQGSPAPGGGTFSPFESASRNHNGAVAFVADISGGTASQGIFLINKGAVTAVALQGSLAPGGGTFSAFDSVSLNDSAVIAFVADVSGGTA